MSLESSKFDNDLRRSGLVVVGEIDLQLIKNVQVHLQSKAIIRRIHRQTQLKWNPECDAIVTFFEENLQPKISTLRDKTCFNRWFVHFHEFSEGSGLYKPGIEQGKYNVLIVIQRGSGFPFFLEGSHAEGDSGVARITAIVEIPQEEGAVVIFDANIGRQDTAVKGNGGTCILLAY